MTATFETKNSKTEGTETWFWVVMNLHNFMTGSVIHWPDRVLNANNFKRLVCTLTSKIKLLLFIDKEDKKKMEVGHINLKYESNNYTKNSFHLFKKTNSWLWGKLKLSWFLYLMW